MDLDVEQIRQLIVNLVRNGLESMGVGGLVTVCTYTQDKDVVLAVSDQGAGARIVPVTGPHGTTVNIRFAINEC